MRYRVPIGLMSLASTSYPTAKLTVKMPSGLVVRGTDASQVAELIRLLSC